MSRIAVTAVFLALLGGLTVFFYSTTGTPSSEPALHFQQDVDDWMDGLKAGKTVTFLTPDRKAIATDVGGIENSALPESERNKVELRLTRGIEQSNKQLDEFRDSMDSTDPSALAQEADLLDRLTQREALLRALRRGDFVLLPSGQALPVPDSIARTIDGFPVTVDGKKLRMHFALMYDENPDIVASETYMTDLSFFAQREAARRFNERPYEERKRVFEEVLAWESEYEEYQRDLIAAAGGSRNDLGEVWRELRSRKPQEMLPSGHRDKINFLIMAATPR